MNIKIFERANETEIQEFLDEKVAILTDTDPPVEVKQPKNVHHILQSESAISSDDGATFFSNVTITILWN